MGVSLKMFPVAEACERVLRFRPSKEQLFRWRNRRTNPLKCQKIGGRFYATLQDVKDFKAVQDSPSSVNGRDELEHALAKL